MPRFACPNCKTVIRASEQDLGAVLRCQSCGKKIRVPAAKSDVKPAAKSKESESENQSKTSWIREKRPSAAVEDEDEEREDQEDAPARKAPRSLVTSVVGSIVGLLVIAGIILVVSGRWVDFLQRPIQKFLEEQGIHPVLAIVVTAAVFLIPAGLFLLHLMKSGILSAMPSDVEFRPALASKFPGLDNQKLAELTAVYGSLGFEPLMDYTIETDVQTDAKAFGRLFVHRGKHCFAEVGQVFTSDRNVPMRSTLMSLMSDRWSAAITDRTPVKEGYLMRLPRAVWRSFPDKEPAELLDELQKLRKAMVRDLQVDVLTDDTAKAYFSREKANTRARKEAVGRRWALGIQIEFWLFDRNRKYEWLGEYARKARK